MIASVMQLGRPMVPTGPLTVYGIYTLAKSERLRDSDSQDAANVRTYYGDALRIGSRRVLELFAVADGASSAPRSGEWARHLTEQFVENFFDYDSVDDWLDSVRASFDNETGMPRSKEQYWYEKEFELIGPQATFAGLVFYDDRTWEFYSCGDTILCYVPSAEHRDIILHPISNQADFRKVPKLVNATRSHGRGAISCATGAYQLDDAFFLTTDAFGQLLVKLTTVLHANEAKVVLGAFSGVEKHKSDPLIFVIGTYSDQFVRFLQQKSLMSDDDVTIIAGRIINA